MDNPKWMFLSLVGFLLFLGLGIAANCNFLGMHDWRGNKAVFAGLSIAILGAWSVITLVIQTLKAATTPISKAGGVVVVWSLVFVGAVTAAVIAKLYCH